MKNISDLPRLPLGLYPTPFYKLESVSKRYGRDVYIKRDDLCGMALGGNKVRKLEFLLAQAKADVTRCLPPAAFSPTTRRSPPPARQGWV